MCRKLLIIQKILEAQQHGAFLVRDVCHLVRREHDDVRVHIAAGGRHRKEGVTKTLRHACGYSAGTLFELNGAAHAMSLLYEFTGSLLVYLTRIKNLRCWKQTYVDLLMSLREFTGSLLVYLT